MLKTNNIESDFITLTSHQLRTPLSGMKWLLELLQKSGTGNLNRKQAEFLEKIYNSNERMIALVNDMLEVSRLEAGETKLYLRACDLPSIIHIILKEKEREIKQRKLNVSFTVEQEPFPQAYTEPVKIKQAFSNLITNAIDFTPDRGDVKINLKTKGGWIYGEIADSGDGIPKDQTKQVFRKFFRGDNRKATETNGTGLGLYISKAFIEASGGKLWFRTKQKKGSIFYFTLPVAK